jgi:hypothetical protein
LLIFLIYSTDNCSQIPLIMSVMCIMMKNVPQIYFCDSLHRCP